MLLHFDLVCNLIVELVTVDQVETLVVFLTRLATTLGNGVAKVKRLVRDSEEKSRVGSRVFEWVGNLALKVKGESVEHVFEVTSDVLGEESTIFLLT